MATLKIHGMPPSSFTRTVRLAAHEKGIDYELVPAFPGQLGALNPFQKIPVISHGDLTLFESTAILRYLDRTFPGPKLWPEDSRGAALCDQWVSAICDSLASSALRYLANHFGFLPVPAEMARCGCSPSMATPPPIPRRSAMPWAWARGRSTATSPASATCSWHRWCSISRPSPA